MTIMCAAAKKGGKLWSKASDKSNSLWKNSSFIHIGFFFTFFTPVLHISERFS